VFLLFAAVALFAGSAGAKPAIPSPFASFPCLDPQDVIADLEAPTGLYVNAKSCPAECHKAEKDCEQYVKFAGSCSKSEILDDESYAKDTCGLSTDSAQKKLCIQNAIQGAGQQRAVIVSHLTSSIDACRVWGDTCQASCP
jgi:hypothetical protein